MRSYKILYCVACVVWFFCCVFLTALYVSDIANVKIHPEDYAHLWGAEHFTGDWSYSSETAYIASGGMMIAWSLLGMFVSSRKNFRHPLPCVIHCCATVLYFAWLRSMYC